MKEKTKDFITKFIGGTIIWILLALAIGLIAKIAYRLVTFAWGLI